MDQAVRLRFKLDRRRPVGAGLSWLEHYVDIVGVVGSSPIPPIEEDSSFLASPLFFDPLTRASLIEVFHHRTDALKVLVS